MTVFPDNYLGVCPIELKIGMVYCMKNTFRNIVFKISVDVPSKSEIVLEEFVYCSVHKPPKANSAR